MAHAIKIQSSQTHMWSMHLDADVEEMKIWLLGLPRKVLLHSQNERRTGGINLCLMLE